MSLILLSLVLPALLAVETTATDAPPSGFSAPFTPSQDMPDARHSVHVSVDAKTHDTLFLVRLPITGPELKDLPPIAICTLPCDTWVEPGAYLVRGSGRVDSERLTLSGGDYARLTIDPGTTWGRAGGKALIGVGFGAVGVGAITWGVAALMSSFTRTGWTNGQTVGVSILVGGLATVVVGVGVLVYNQTRIDYHFDPNARIDPRVLDALSGAFRF
jgi:hypothetical protein